MSSQRPKGPGSLTLRARVTIGVSLLLGSACSRSPTLGTVRVLGLVCLLLLGGCPKSLTDPGYVLSLSPPVAALYVEDSTHFTATVRDRDGNVVPMTFAWSSSDPAVATISANGMVLAVGPGSAIITVTSGDLTASASVTVSADNGQTLTVEPAAADVFVNTSTRFTATLRDRDGDVLPATPTWSSTNPAVATVDANGLARGVTTGSATIRARVGDMVAGAALSVSPRPSGGAVLVGAGDIASCAYSQDEATAALLDGIAGTVFTVGDNAYPDGTAQEYASCYGPTWGRHKARTRPVPGNHEYFTPAATGYFDYFGAAAGDPARGYYSYDVGAWHVIALNSNLAMTAGSPQEQWLRADLLANPVRCTIAYWHHPRFSSGAEHGSSPHPQPLWQALYDAGADVVIVGHDHTYERFAPQNGAGQLDLARGIRQFVVGTGGANLYGFNAPAPNSEVRSNSARGVLKLTLYGDRYEWEFLPVAGRTFTDVGSASCH